MTHFDFIEIGTSDFNTLAERAGPQHRGLSVEPIKKYLSRLPVKPLVTKVNAAVSDKPGQCVVHYLDEHTIQAHGLPNYLRGCNSIDSPHPTVSRWLQKKGLPTSLVRKDTVPKITYCDLIQRFGVSSVDLLKVDTEGHDGVILRSLIACCEQQPSLLPKQIVFESNKLTDRREVNYLIKLLEAHGYELVSRGHDTKMKLKGTTAAFSSITDLDVVWGKAKQPLIAAGLGGLALWLARK